MWNLFLGLSKNIKIWKCKEKITKENDIENWNVSTRDFSPIIELNANVNRFLKEESFRFLSSISMRLCLHKCKCLYIFNK